MTATTNTTEVVTHDSLAAALAAFQAEVQTFSKNKTANAGTYTYKYADLGEIIPKVGPLLAKHGLSWSAKPARADDGEFVLRYVLRHVSGETDGDEMPLGVRQGVRPQELGSAITYMRRYALTAQLNIATDEDDDAQRSAPVAQRSAPVAQPPAGTERMASAKQRGLICAKASEQDMPPTDLAACILAAAGQPSRDFETQAAAQAFVNRQLDRLPARLVNPVLAEIAKPAPAEVTA